eukprot:m51a1_g5446 putative superfamily ii helicase (1071) ;mRNA; r:198018-201704
MPRKAKDKDAAAEAPEPSPETEEASTARTRPKRAAAARAARKFATIVDSSAETDDDEQPAVAAAAPRETKSRRKRRKDEDDEDVAPMQDGEDEEPEGEESAEEQRPKKRARGRAAAAAPKKKATSKRATRARAKADAEEENVVDSDDSDFEVDELLHGEDDGPVEIPEGEPRWLTIMCDTASVTLVEDAVDSTLTDEQIRDYLSSNTLGVSSVGCLTLNGTAISVSNRYSFMYPSVLSDVAANGNGLWSHTVVVERARKHILSTYSGYNGYYSGFGCGASDTKPRKPEVTVDIRSKLSIDLNKLEFYVRNGIPVPGRAALFRHANKEKYVDFDCMKEPNVLLCSSVPIKQPDRVQTPMFKYQLEALNWMLTVENRCKENVWELSNLRGLPGAPEGYPVLFDEATRIIHLQDEDRPGSKCKLGLKGAIYADGVGLGKTLAMISLICQNRADKRVMWSNPRCGDRVRSCATLVMCPSHLVSQWVREIEKHTKPKLKVYAITTIVQAAKLSYKDLILADVVVISFQFIKNKSYIKAAMFHDTTFSKSADAPIMVELWRRKSPLSKKCPLLEGIFWHRLVLDEGHEVLCAGGNMAQYLESYHSTYRWYMTGTPFPHEADSLVAALQFLGSSVTGLSPDLLSLVHESLYWRNTRDTIGEEAKIPDTVEEVIFLEQSDIERGMYRAAQTVGNELQMRQICCHPQISKEDRDVLGEEKKTLEEIRKDLITHGTKKLHSAVNHAANCRMEIAELKVKIAQLEVDQGKGTADEKKKLKAQINEFTKMLDNTTGQLLASENEAKFHRANIAYFESIQQRLVSSPDSPCVICLEPITEAAVTPCGHLFCRKCISEAVGVQGRCPTCRAAVRPSDVVAVVEKEHREQLSKEAEESRLVQQYGTKMARLILYLREAFEADDEARVIVFSEWDSLLTRVGSTLQENGISNVYCKGNVHVRNKAVEEFTKGSAKVIMLSLENAASGLNLTQASHLVLLSPVAGSVEYARATEAQAIGRAHRIGQKKPLAIVRFIVKDTVEHRIYTTNYAPAEGSTRASLSRSQSFAQSQSQQNPQSPESEAPAAP